MVIGAYSECRRANKLHDEMLTSYTVTLLADAAQSSRPVDSARAPEVPRPHTPIPEVLNNPTRAASARLPRSVPLADYLGRSSLGQTGNGNDGGDAQRTSGHVVRRDGAKSTGWNSVASTLAVHKPAVAAPPPKIPYLCPPPPVPTNWRTVPAAVRGSSSIVAPLTLPPRNLPSTTSEDSPYVKMYPLQPPRSEHATTTPPNHSQ